MRKTYAICINGEYYLYDLNVLQAYWIAAALYVAGYWKSNKRVRVKTQDFRFN